MAKLEGSMMKKGQMMIWVIIAMAFTVSMIFFFTISKKPDMFKAEQIDPSSYIESCARKTVNDALSVMLPQGGAVSPENYVLYKGIKVRYLCENSGNFLPCLNQHPMLFNEMRAELKNLSIPAIGQCFDMMMNELAKRDVTASLGNQEIDVLLGPGKVYLNITRRLTTEKNGESRLYESFKAVIPSPAYDLAFVAREIASQEAKYCYFDYLGYSIIYPRYDIKLDRIQDSIKIYTIKDKFSTKETNIAIRGCAIPAGI